MSEGKGVSFAEVRRVAELANLELSATELPGMERDLNAILGHIDELNLLDTKGVSAMAQVSEWIEETVLKEGEPLRADVVRPSIDRGMVMRAAPETDGRFFKVPKVIER